MTKDYSPFTPGIPVPVDFFVGREAEVKRIVAASKKAATKSTLERIFVEGERGIGKSSLCQFARVVAQRDASMIGVHVYLGGVSTVEEMIRRILVKLVEESVDKAWHEKLLSFFGDRIEKAGMFGVSFDLKASKSDLTRMASDFAPALRKLADKIGPDKKGIFIVLDDLNGLLTTDSFANWLKSFVDEVATASKPLPLVLVLAGRTEQRNQLIERQPSLDRVFSIASIEGFSRSESDTFFNTSFNEVGMTVTDEALWWLWEFSDGLPVLMHELGEATFEVDTDNTIDEDDSIAGTRRAIDVVGTKYVEPNVVSAVRSEKYQSILRKIVTTENGFLFKKKIINPLLSSDESKVFNHFLRRMEELGVIRKKRELGPGSYEFCSQLYYAFFRIQARSKYRNRQH